MLSVVLLQMSTDHFKNHLHGKDLGSIPPMQLTVGVVKEAAEDEVHGGKEDEQQQEELHLDDPLDARHVDERQQEQTARSEGLLRP